MLFSAAHLLVLGARMHRGLIAEPLGALGLASREDLVLAELWREEGLTQSELARRLALRRSTVTTVLRTMERRDLVRRVPDDRDGRLVRVHPTERAATLRPEVEEIWSAAEAALLRGLTGKDAAELRRLLGRAVARARRKRRNQGMRTLSCSSRTRRR